MKQFFLYVLVLSSLILRSQSSPVCFNSLISANLTTVGNLPMHLCTADFNGDGKSDVAVANESSNNVSILLGSGTGTFSPAVNYAAGTSPWSICTADFNSDGKPDLAVTNVGTNNLSILMGTGLGTFSAAVNYSTGSNGYSVRAADFNGDNNVDIALVKSGSIGILLGSSTGTFATPQNYTAGTNPYALCITDFNADGKADIAVANNTSANISILFGTTTGTLSASVNYSVPASPCAIDFADFNVDGHPDICVTSCLTGSISVLLGSASGTFAAALNYYAGTQPYAILAADYNNDGFPDMAVSKASSHAISVFLGTGTGSFATPVDYLTIDQPYDLISSDFNGDGILDLIHTSYYSTSRVTLILGSGNGVFSANLQYPVGTSPYYLKSADFNGDGKLDLATANWSSNDVSVLMGLAGGTFSTAVTYSVGLKPYSLVPSDFNGDGSPDLAVCNFSSNSVSVLLASVSGTFGAATNFSVGNNPYGIVSEDFDLDGKKDIAVTNFNSNSVSILLGNGSGGFAAPVNYSTASLPYSIASADLNGDGNKDLAFTNSGGFVSLLIGSSTGVFSYGPSYPVGTSPQGLSIKDFNGDLKQDIVVANFNSNSISVLMGSGAGTFTSTTGFTVGTNPMSVESDDYNMDGIPDISVTNYNAFNVGVLLGTGTGSFLPQIVFGVGANPRSLISYDFNSDGKKDLALVNMGYNNISVLLNASPTLSVSSANTVCLGNSINVTVSGANTYSWSNGVTTNPAALTPTSNTTYTILGLSFGGCTATAVKSITVNVLPLPTITVNSGSICLGQTFTINPSGANTYSFTGGSAIVTPNVTKAYTVTGTNTLTGCRSNSVVSNVTVYPFPIISVSSGTICAGQSFSIVASGASSYNYPGGSSIVSPLTSTSYSVTGSNAQGCVSPPALANVGVFPTPTISVNSGVICIGKSFTITPSGAINYTYTGGNAVVSPTVNSFYSITGTSSLGCVSASAAICSITVNALPVLSITGNNSVCKNSAISLLANGTVLTYTWSSGGNTNLVTLTPSITSVYTVNGTDANSCIGSATKTITVNNLPVVTAAASNTMLCSGMQVTLSGGGAAFYNWNGGVLDNVPFPINSGFTITIGVIYTVIGTDVNGCQNTATVSIQVFPNPTLTISGNATALCAGETTTLTVTGANLYNWNTGSSDSIIALNPTVTTIYTVIGTGVNSCTSTAQFVQIVDACTDLTSLSRAEVLVIIYPNPTNGEFFMELLKEIDITVVDALGRFILSQHVGEGKNKIDLSSYSNGVYFIQLKQDNILRTIKLIKE